MQNPVVQVWADKHSSLMPRVSFKDGSFFEAGNIPAATSNKDVFTMRQILHDWSDADGISILKQVLTASQQEKSLVNRVCSALQGSLCIEPLQRQRFVGATTSSNMCYMC